MIFLQDAPPPPVVGDRAPDVSFRRPDGSTLRLSSLKGKIVVLEFSILACPPCRALAPKLEALAAKNPDVVFLTVCVDTAQAASAMMRDRPKNAKTVFVQDLRQKDLSKMSQWKFGFLGYPNLFVVGRDSRMASRYLMEDPDPLIHRLEWRIAWARKRT